MTRFNLLNVGLVAAFLPILAGPNTRSQRSHPDRSEITVDTVHSMPTADTLVVSFARASEWLENLDELDREDQVRDWAVLGLAGLLGVGPEALRDFSYDKTPLRDPLFGDITANSVGPGRALPDGKGTLHLLVPQSDPYLARTVGMLLDDYRKDSGTDPIQVQIHRSQIDWRAAAVRIWSSAPRPAAAVRREFGYYEVPVGTMSALQWFLANTHHLSRLERRGGQLWAGGWNWPGVPTARISVEDITVLQRGYEGAAPFGYGEPGFSLDPGPVIEDMDDVLALLRQYPDAQEALLAFSMAQSAWQAQVKSAASDSEKADVDDHYLKVLKDLRQQYGHAFHAARNWIGQRPVYQFARYDGGLKGTAVGMTYFYTDLVAKAWPMEIGTGNPHGVVPGFVSNLDARTPWGHCSITSESGRLWFGLREDAIAVHRDHIDLGGITSRLFSRVDDPVIPDREIEPSYRFGRIMWWWDRHYLSMADYEPEYHRLDQLMRWGAAIAWVVDSGAARLPMIGSNQVTSGWQFRDWLRAKPDLKWRYDIPFVTPTGVASEALLSLSSEWYEDCNSAGRFWWGGISNPRIARIRALRAEGPQLKQSLARGGLKRSATQFSPISRSGTIGSETVRRTLSPPGLNATVDVVAEGRKVWSFAGLKTSIEPSAPRRYSLRLTSSPGHIDQSLSVQGVHVADLSISARGTLATIRVDGGVMSRARRFLSSLQEQLPGKTLRDAVHDAEGASLSYPVPSSGRHHARLDGAGESRWITIEPGAPTPGNQLAFRLGKPSAKEGELLWYNARFADAPTIPAASGQASAWMTVTPRSGGRPASVRSGRAPDPQRAGLTVTYTDGRRGQAFVEEGEFLVRSSDPVFGLRGTDDGAQLFDAATWNRLVNAQEAAIQTGDGYYRAVAMPHGRVAVVDRDAATIGLPYDQWHARVQDVLGLANNNQVPLFKFHKGQALAVERARVITTGSPGGVQDLSAVMQQAGLVPGRGLGPRGPPMYLAANVFPEGSIPSAAIGAGPQVRVVRAQPEMSTVSSTATPDIWLWGNREWYSARDVRGQPLTAGTTVSFVFLASDCGVDRPPPWCQY